MTNFASQRWRRLLGRSSRALQSIARLTTGQYLRVLLGLVAAPLLARALGSSDRGIFALVATFDAATSLIAALGAPQAFAYFLRPTREGSVEEALAFAMARSALHRIAIRTAILVTPVGLLVGGFFGRTIGLAAAGVIITTYTSTLNQFGRQVAGLRKREWLYSVIDSATPGIQSIGVILLATFGTLSLASALGVLVLSRAFAAIPVFFVWRKGSGRERSTEFDRYGMKAVPTQLAQLSRGRIDQLALIPLGTAAIGIYAIAGIAAGLLQPLFIALNVRTFRSDTTVATRTILIGLAALVMLGAIVGWGAYFMIEPLFGEEYATAAAPAFWLCLASAGNGIFLILRALLDRAGQPGLASMMQVGFVAAFAVVAPLAALQFGILGVAIVAVPLQACRVTATIWLCRRAGVLT